MTEQKLKLAILTGSDSAATCLCVSALLSLPNTEIAGILVDDERTSWAKRWHNLRRNVRREGPAYLWFRAVEFACELAERLASRVVPRGEAEDILRESFPERTFSLSDFSRIYGVKVFHVGNLNGDVAARMLQRLQSDLGVVIGTRLLKRPTFSIPRLGCVNLHKGKVPEYRGLPPGFWELYDGQSTAGVTVHFIDDGLDTGDILEERSTGILAADTPESLRKKLDILGSEALADCIANIAAGSSTRRPQPPSPHRPRTIPTRRQRIELARRRMSPAETLPAWIRMSKTFVYLCLYYSGIYHVTKAFHQRKNANRSTILLYHRISDLTHDVLTTGLRCFAEHLAMLRKHYRIAATPQLVADLQAQRRISGSPVLIHFDDCYRDIYTNASRMLSRIGFPACAFVSTGFVDTDRVFAHDEGECPFRMENLRRDEIPRLMENGFEVGSHTVNHVDLGQCSYSDAFVELYESKRDLERSLGRPVNLVSYPYGRPVNISAEAVEAARKVGYEAMFSAYGGHVNGSSDLFDLRRIGMSGRYPSLDFLMEIEGLSLGALRRRWAKPSGSAQSDVTDRHEIEPVAATGHPTQSKQRKPD